MHAPTPIPGQSWGNAKFTLACSVHGAPSLQTTERAAAESQTILEHRWVCAPTLPPHVSLLQTTERAAVESREKVETFRSARGEFDLMSG